MKVSTPGATTKDELPRVNRDRAERALLALDRLLGTSKILTAADNQTHFERYAHDESELTWNHPDGVVLAETTEDVMACLQVCQQLEVPVTPRGLGSGKTGGAVPVVGGIVLSTEKMAGIYEISREDLLVRAGPGTILGVLQEAVEREGLFYPPDPASLAYCAIGGNVAENAGGPRAFKYGVTREYTLGAEVVLMGGERLSVGRRTAKGVTGYDVMGTLVGSEGTLGVFTDLTLRLVAKPPEVRTLLALFGNVAHASQAVTTLVAQGLRPRCLELLDEGALSALRTAGAAIDERAGAMLLLEIDGHPPLDHELEVLGEACLASAAIDVLVAQDEAQRTRLWAARRDLSPTLRKLARWKLSEDVVVPRSELVSLLDVCARIRDEEQVRTLAYGHAGDGNLHVNFLWDDPDHAPRVERAIARLFQETIRRRGTLSGEHGIGVLKAPFLPLEQSASLIALQQRIKSAFDPKGLLNPGKIFPVVGTHRAC